MPDTEKYLNPPNLGREDENNRGWKLGDIVHTAGSYVRANSYNYCGYEQFDIPVGSRARIIGIKQTDLNAAHILMGRLSPVVTGTPSRWQRLVVSSRSALTAVETPDTFEAPVSGMKAFG